MKMKSIIISNYKGIKNQVIAPDKLNVFLGKCGSGKSSVLDAICFAFAGKAKEEDINKGEEQASVKIVFEDDTSIERIRKKSGVFCKCNGKNSTAGAVNAYLLSKIGTDIGTFEAMSSTDYFASISQKDLSELFLSVMPLNINFDAMIQLIEEDIEKVTDEKRDFLAKLFPAMPSKYGLDEIEKGYKDSFQKRKSKKAEVKAISARCIFDESTLPKETREVLQEELYRIAEKESAYNALEKNMSQYQRAVENQKKAADRLKSLEAIAKGYEAVQKPDEQKFMKAKSDKKQFEDAVSNHKQAMAALEANVQLFKRTLDSLDKPVCPISQKLVCTTDKSGIKNELIAQINKNNSVIEQHRIFIARCQEQIQKRDAFIESYTISLSAYEKKLSYQSQIKEFVLPEIPEKPKEIQKEDFASQKREVNRKLSILANYEVVLKNREDEKKAKKKLELYEFACRVLDAKSGVRNSILKKTLLTFEKLCNQKAKALRKDFSIEFKCEEGIEVLVEPHHGTGYLPMKSLSTGESVFAAYLLMSIIQAITGSKYIILDNLDRLDLESLESLIELIRKDDVYEHVFIGAVNHSDTEKLMKSIPDATTIFM